MRAALLLALLAGGCGATSPEKSEQSGAAMTTAQRTVTHDDCMAHEVKVAVQECALRSIERFAGDYDRTYDRVRPDIYQTAARLRAQPEERQCLRLKSQRNVVVGAAFNNAAGSLGGFGPPDIGAIANACEVGARAAVRRACAFEGSCFPNPVRPSGATGRPTMSPMLRRGMSQTIQRCSGTSMRRTCVDKELAHLSPGDRELVLKALPKFMVQDEAEHPDGLVLDNILVD